MEPISKVDLTSSKEPAGAKPSAPRLVAVIDIGSTSIRMGIAQIDGTGSVRPLESLQQAVSLGKDTFTKGAIEATTTDQCVGVLRSFREILQQYQITDEHQIRAVATSAVREATNRDAFLDRVYVASGFNVEVIDEAETNRITYLAVSRMLDSEPSLSRGDTLIIEVGGGNTEALLLRKGQVSYSHTYHLGSLRLREMLDDYEAPVVELPEIMEVHIDRAVRQIKQRLSVEGHTDLMALGGDIRFAVSHLVENWDKKALIRLPVSSLAKLTKEVLSYSADELVRRYHLAYPDAESLGPALLIYTRLAKAFRLRHMLVSTGTLRDGLIWEMATREAWSDEFRKHIVRSALEIGRKYQFDEPHASHVAALSKLLFDSLRKEHQLPSRFETLLTVAALLHDIGLFVSNRSHHKHSMYLVLNSDLFGLSARDLQMVALVTRYHRRALPRTTHEGYAGMDRQTRVGVSKLAAMLRVADALDSGHSQRIHNVSLHVESGVLRIEVRGAVGSLMLERYALLQKSEMFEQVYGMKVILQETS